jgi:hypothetical protein
MVYRFLRDLVLPWRPKTRMPDAPAAQQEDARFENLLCRLPPFAQAEFRRRTEVRHPLVTTAEMFKEARSWMISAGIAEGRGGYPGGRDAPGWLDYIADQRRHIAVFKALVAAFGEAPGDGMETLHAYEKAYPAPVRRLGEADGPHVDDAAGRLVYVFPTTSGTARTQVFEIREADLRVLLDAPDRRAVLEAGAEQMLQRASIRRNPEVTPAMFRNLLDQVLHASRTELAASPIRG